MHLDESIAFRRAIQDPGNCCAELDVWGRQLGTANVGEITRPALVLVLSSRILTDCLRLQLVGAAILAKPGPRARS